MPATITPSKSLTTSAAHSHPEAEERQAKRAAKTWPVKSDLVMRLRAYQSSEGLTNIDLGRRLGYPDGTVVSKYFGDQKMDRDPSDFERRGEFLLTASLLRRHFEGEIIETNVVKKVAVFIDRCRAIGKPGIFTGEAGIGKTVGIDAYLAHDPTAVGITADVIRNDARGVMGLLWQASGAWGQSNEPRMQRLVAKYKGSRRPIIVDGAQQLGAGGRAFLFDFHDATGCPPVLFGNPVIHDQVARVDQHHSRTYLAGSAELEDQERVVRAIVSHYLDDPEAVLDLALLVVARARGGHLRTLENLLTATRVLMELPANASNPRGCFEKALSYSVIHRDLAKAK